MFGTIISDLGGKICTKNKLTAFWNLVNYFYSP